MALAACLQVLPEQAGRRSSLPMRCFFICTGLRHCVGLGYSSTKRSPSIGPKCCCRRTCVQVTLRAWREVARALQGPVSSAPRVTLFLTLVEASSGYAPQACRKESIGASIVQKGIGRTAGNKWSKRRTDNIAAGVRKEVSKLMKGACHRESRC